MAEETKNTETKTGAEPANTTEAKAGAEPAAEPDAKKSASSTEGEPWHKDPRFKQELGLLKAAKALMEKNNLESVDDLVELAESGSKVRGKQVDLDRLEEIVAKAAKLDKYEAYWNAEAERKRREQEDPESTIARLEKELKHKEFTERQREERKRQAESARQAIDYYEREVSDQVKELDLPKDQAAYLMEYCGVGNQANDIDITDRKAVRKIIADGNKKFQALKQAIIKEYVDGKSTVPKMSSSSAATVTETKPKIMLKDARKIFLENIQKASGG